jgi:hypothetical protein
MFVMVRTDLKGRIELGVEGLDVLASLALRTRTFSPGLVTPLRLYLPYRKKTGLVYLVPSEEFPSQLNQKYSIQVGISPHK